MVTKADLRKQWLQFRQQLSPEEHAHRSAQIVQHLINWPLLQEAQVIHMFWPMLDRHEVDLRPLWHHLRAQGKQIVLPVMSRHTQLPRLQHIALQSLEMLRQNTWGVWEPIGGATIPVENLDLVIVPALAVDRRGYRLGYGKGYYDAFLQEVQAPTISPIFQEAQLEALPAEPHDIPVDYIVTEAGVFSPATSLT